MSFPRFRYLRSVNRRQLSELLGFPHLYQFTLVVLYPLLYTSHGSRVKASFDDFISLNINDCFFAALNSWRLLNYNITDS